MTLSALHSVDAAWRQAVQKTSLPEGGFAGVVPLLSALPCGSPQESIAAQSRASLRGPHRSRSQDDSSARLASKAAQALRR